MSKLRRSRRRATKSTTHDAGHEYGATPRRPTTARRPESEAPDQARRDRSPGSEADSPTTPQGIRCSQQRRRRDHRQRPGRNRLRGHVLHPHVQIAGGLPSVEHTGQHSDGQSKRADDQQRLLTERLGGENADAFSQASTIPAIPTATSGAVTRAGAPSTASDLNQHPRHSASEHEREPRIPRTEQSTQSRLTAANRPATSGSGTGAGPEKTTLAKRIRSPAR